MSVTTNGNPPSCPASPKAGLDLSTTGQPDNLRYLLLKKASAFFFAALKSSIKESRNEVPKELNL
ncbi:hypothetical protein DDT91_19820 [Algoriphagus sp. AK58]|nr:hypothetical protein [Algoriphagus sp. AK58]